MTTSSSCQDHLMKAGSTIWRSCMVPWDDSRSLIVLIFRLPRPLTWKQGSIGLTAPRNDSWALHALIFVLQPHCLNHDQWRPPRPSSMTTITPQPLSMTTATTILMKAGWTFYRCALLHEVFAPTEHLASWISSYPKITRAGKHWGQTLFYEDGYEDEHYLCPALTCTVSHLVSIAITWTVCSTCTVPCLMY